MQEDVLVRHDSDMPGPERQNATFRPLSKPMNSPDSEAAARCVREPA